MASMSFTYFRVGKVLWGSQGIGESVARQMESIKSKKKVANDLNVFKYFFKNSQSIKQKLFSVEFKNETVLFRKRKKFKSLNLGQSFESF